MGFSVYAGASPVIKAVIPEYKKKESVAAQNHDALHSLCLFMSDTNSIVTKTVQTANSQYIHLSPKIILATIAATYNMPVMLLFNNSTIITLACYCQFLKSLRFLMPMGVCQKCVQRLLRISPLFPIVVVPIRDVPLYVPEESVCHVRTVLQS